MATALRPCAAKALVLHRALVANFSAGCLMAVFLPRSRRRHRCATTTCYLAESGRARNARAPAPPPPAGCATTAPRPPAAAPQPAAPLAGPPIPWGRCSRAHGAGCAWALGERLRVVAPDAELPSPLHHPAAIRRLRERGKRCQRRREAGLLIRFHRLGWTARIGAVFIFQARSASSTASPGKMAVT